MHGSAERYDDAYVSDVISRIVDIVTDVDPGGFGRPLFDDYNMPIDLDLLEQRSFESGVTMHRYAIRDTSEASAC